MSNDRYWGGSIRKIRSAEREKYRDHLLRLDSEDRILRFAHGVSDEFIKQHAMRVNFQENRFYGFFRDDNLHAVGELHRIGDTWSKEAEGAFSVESAYQNRGIGTELMGRVILAARNRGIQHLIVRCLTDNSKMKSLAGKHDAQMKFGYDYSELVGDIEPRTADCWSWMSEVMEDRMEIMNIVFDLMNRSRNVA